MVVSEEPAAMQMFVCIPDHIKQYINKMEDLDGFVEAETLTNVHMDFPQPATKLWRINLD